MLGVMRSAMSTSMKNKMSFTRRSRPPAYWAESVALDHSCLGDLQVERLVSRHLAVLDVRPVVAEDLDMIWWTDAHGLDGCGA